MADDTQINDLEQLSPKKKIKSRRKKRARKVKSAVTKSAVFDRVNYDLKRRFGVKHINYVSDNGIIQNGWVISSIDAVDEAIKLLQSQNAPIYILGELASAFVMWSLTRSKTIKGELWIDSNLKDSFDTAGPVDYEMTKQYLVDWCAQAGINKEIV